MRGRTNGHVDVFYGNVVRTRAVEPMLERLHSAASLLRRVRSIEELPANVRQASDVDGALTSGHGSVALARAAPTCRGVPPTTSFP